jgi:hypothetical protein
VTYSLTNTDDDTVLKALVDIAENVPKYLRPAIDDIFNLCLQVRIKLYLKYFFNSMIN